MRWGGERDHRGACLRAGHRMMGARAAPLDTDPAACSSCPPLSLHLRAISPLFSVGKSPRTLPFSPFLWLRAAVLVVSTLLVPLLLLLQLLEDPSP